ncbi:unnamed protein product [Hymenolepis diminuta]|uniref:Cytochrome b-c1 complex subunit 3 n=1 Tax=Hymenolepis diminuta TaxID=6216 RepID=A0A0R3SM93_HYMDI|nr:unnamed protein product [Hymenolepis diminuta]
MPFFHNDDLCVRQHNNVSFLFLMLLFLCIRITIFGWFCFTRVSLNSYLLSPFNKMVIKLVSFVINSYFGSIGFILYLLLMVEAFTATVLTSVAERLPISVTGFTLIRVFSVHICLGFVILALITLHLLYLHKSGRKMLFKKPHELTDNEAYLEADPMKTPLMLSRLDSHMMFMVLIIISTVEVIVGDGKRWLAFLSLAHIIVPFFAFLLFFFYCLGHGLSAGISPINYKSGSFLVVLRLLSLCSFPPTVQFFCELSLLLLPRRLYSDLDT